ncbi:MAG: OmpA family protein [Deltaproteobacteria bacterium]|nr:OmpA family protein [Deltaproteobacteria bacterium]
MSTIHAIQAAKRQAAGRTATRRARGLAALGALLLWPAGSRGEIAFAVHAEGAAARMFGERKVDEFGWGAAGLVAPEIELGSNVGIELPIGALGLTDGVKDEEGFAETEGGSALFVLPGLRVRPFGHRGSGRVLGAAGLWLAASGGIARTGELVRPAVAARAGYDFAVGPARIGPFGGLLQIVETTNELRPEDARIALLGLHGAFEPAPTAERKAPAEPKRVAEDPDRDHDGIANASDGCPDDPEDADGFEDADGCPDPDNDRDQVLDGDDRCPLVAEDRDGFEDADGCPDPDNDRDRITDRDDRCPNDPEDADGFEDADGCPDLDNDGDGIADARDDCPNDPETFNGYDDDDGCPDQQNVRVSGNEIVLDERIYFRVNSAEIQLRSWPLVANVASLLLANPQYALVRVQGHADDTGTAEYNERLSAERGRSVVRMLTDFGVRAKRLVVESFGDSRPAETGTSAAARRKNRRVEFLILQREPRPGEQGAPATGSPSGRLP